MLWQDIDMQIGELSKKAKQFCKKHGVKGKFYIDNGPGKEKHACFLIPSLSEDTIKWLGFWDEGNEYIPGYEDLETELEDFLMYAKRKSDS